MDRLWAPWRMAYILQATGEQGSQECIFCRFPAEGKALYADNLILSCNQSAFVIMNRFPYNSGHIMVIPRRHGADLSALPVAEYQATCELLRKAQQILCRELSAHGCNIGMNLEIFSELALGRELVTNAIDASQNQAAKLLNNFFSDTLLTNWFQHRGQGSRFAKKWNSYKIAVFAEELRSA